MLKKILGVLVCVSILSFFQTASAHDGFTWFGLRRNNTEVMFRTSDSNVHCDHHDCHKHKPKKHKPKPKPKHKHHKKGPHHFKWWW